MPIHLHKRPSGIWHLRGSHHGVTVDRSSRTRDRGAATKVREAVEREIFDTVVLGKPPERSFAEAAIGYMKSGGERATLAPILTCEIPLTDNPRDMSRRRFADWPLKEIDQAAINRVAETLYPIAKPATRNRKVFTPIAAVLNYAAEQPTWQYAGFRLRRPEEPKGRIDWRRPAEIEWWLDRAGHMRGLLTAYVGTGARASELIGLDWLNVSPGGHRLTLWDDETKAEAARSIDLQQRVRMALPNRPETDKGRVFLNQAGNGWASYDAVNNALEKITERETLRASTATELADLKPLRATYYRRLTVSPADRAAAGKAYRSHLELVRKRAQVPRIHCHIFRHTWATWAYAVTRDLTFLMGQGGWASEKLALRYIHGGSDDIRAEVLDFGWEMRAAPVQGLAKPVSDAR